MFRFIGKKRFTALLECERRVQSLEDQLGEKKRLVEELSRSYAGNDLTGIAEVLCRTLSGQMDRTRDLGERQVRGLMEGIEKSRQRIERLQVFIAIAMRHIGRLEGLSRCGGHIRLECSESRDLILAAEHYQRSLQS